MNFTIGIGNMVFPPAPPVEPLVAEKEALLARKDEIMEVAWRRFEQSSQHYFGLFLDEEKDPSRLTSSLPTAHRTALDTARTALALCSAFDKLEEQPFEHGKASDHIVELAVSIKKEWGPW